MRLTKNDLARVIVQALYNLDELPAADNCNVLAMARTNKLEDLARQHKLAVKVILDRISEPLPAERVELKESKLGSSIWIVADGDTFLGMIRFTDHCGWAGLRADNQLSQNGLTKEEAVAFVTEQG